MPARVAIILVLSLLPSDAFAANKAGLVEISGQIDEMLRAATPDFDTKASPRCTDAEFLRRAYLDLHGTIPPAAVVREFSADQSGDKRSRLIDKLLDSPRYARRMADLFNIMLMERRPDVYVPVAEWHDYLRKSFLENKPLDQLAFEILASDGTDASTRPAAKFFLDRKLNIDLVTRDLGRVFLGRDMECAQCHDHPNVDDYLQRHYHGLAAFMKRAYLYTDSKKKKTYIGEKAEGDVTFTSVFTNESNKTNPRLLDLPEFVDPPNTQKQYIDKPTSKVRGVPIYSRRQQLAYAMLSDANVDFRRNWANRLWAMMMGRGLVEPVDLYHSSNPASHPELLEFLAVQLDDHQFDVKWMLRQLALTESYQRSSETKLDSAEPSQYLHALLKPLSPEQMGWSILEATGSRKRTLETVIAGVLKSDPKFGKGRSEHPVWQDVAVAEALKSRVAQLATIFAPTAPGPEVGFDASADQALFMYNGAELHNLISVDKSPGLMQRLAKIEDPTKVVEAACVATLSRTPTTDESQQLANYIKSSSDKAAATKDIVWALLTSAEFRFNH